MKCSKCCKGKSGSVLKGIEYTLPNTLTVTEYFRNSLMSGNILADNPAILGDRGSIAFTFRQLDSLSTKLGKALRAYLGYWTTNNPDNDLVMGFCLPINEIVPVLILAILKLGATYVAIPSTYHEKQIVKIVGVTRPMIVITESNGPTTVRFDCVRHLLTVIGIDDIMDLASNDRFDDVNEVVPLETLVKPYKRMACIVYTAGTIDEPQAVRIGHLEILNRCCWQYKTLPYGPNEIGSLSSNIADVDSIAEMLAPILAGIPLYLIPRHVLATPTLLMDSIQENKISRITLAPLELTALLTAYDEMNAEEQSKYFFGSMKYWFVSGATLTLELAHRFFSCQQRTTVAEQRSAILVHMYGSTEVMSDVSYDTFKDSVHLDSKSINGNVSIGKPIGNTRIYIADEDMKIVNLGVIGEIYVAGACVAAGGYVGNVDHGERFCANPFTKNKVFLRMYKTGDFGQIIVNKNGSRHLFYEGRTEMTAKVRGKRIDLRDITEAVKATKLVEQCSVFCYRPDTKDQVLVACCKLLPSVTTDELKTALISEIHDEHVVPEIFLVDTFQYLPSGRLDKHKLLKQYQYFRMNTTPEDWDQLGLDAAQKDAAKVLFSAIANFTGKSVRYIISSHESSMWNLGVNSLSAIGIFLNMQENNYALEIHDFLQSTSLTSLVHTMVKSKEKRQSHARLALNEMARICFTVETLQDRHKSAVIQMLSKCYAKKNELSIYLSATGEDHAKFLEWSWNKIIKANLSLVAMSRNDQATIVGAVIILDGCTKHKLPRDFPASIKHIRELEDYGESAPKEHMVWGKKGTVTQALMLGTSEAVSTRDNILVISLLLEHSFIRAKGVGYNGVMITCINPLLRDLCQGIFHQSMLKEVLIHPFRAKDKTKPFRLASGHHKLQVFYGAF